jgi:hypothetical protein
MCGETYPTKPRQAMNRSDYRPDYEYSFEEFVEHCDFFLQPFEVPMSSGERRKKSARYFAQRYADRREARYKATRFALAIAYLQRHITAFEEFSVAGKRVGLVTKPLMYALWAYYGAIPDDHLHEEPEVELIQNLACEAKREQQA